MIYRTIEGDFTVEVCKNGAYVLLLIQYWESHFQVQQYIRIDAFMAS